MNGEKHGKGASERARRKEALRESETFAAWGRRHVILLRGRWGLAIDNVVTWLTGYSLVSKQYSVAGRQAYQPVIMLTTIGAKTGKRRTSVLPFYPDGDRMVIIGSAAGGPKDPKWVGNLRKNPNVRVRRKWTTRRAHAHVARGAERERLWSQIVPGRPSIARYQERAHPRQIPFVVLELE